MFCCYAPNWNLIKQSKSLQPCQPQHCGQLHDCFSYSFNAGKIMVLGTRIVMVFVVESLFCNHSLAHIRIVQSGHEKWWKNKMKSKAKQKFICMQIKRMLMLIRVNKRFKMYKHILLVCDVGMRMCVVHAVQKGKWLWTFCSSSSSVTETPSVSMRMHNYHKSYVCSWHMHARPHLVP